jgi:hypothetical protein
MYTGIVKPHYRLLGMLLERRELRAELATRVMLPAKLQNDVAINQLESQLESLDEEIRAHQREVRQMFMAEGRSPDELRQFIGDDLMDELAAVYGSPRELVS